MIRKLVKFFAGFGILVLGLILGVNFWIVSSTQQNIYYSTNGIPTKQVALVLGTSKHTSDGGTNKYFEERIRTAANLYHSGVVRHILVSGDNRTPYYNEPRDMLKALDKLGVPQEAITLDFAGFRTLDSVVRSKMVFGQDELIIITQDFHCYRALFIAHYYEIDAIAFSADHKDELPVGLATREILARFNTILDLYIFRRSPKFLGEEERI